HLCESSARGSLWRQQQIGRKRDQRDGYLPTRQDPHCVPGCGSPKFRPSANYLADVSTADPNENIPPHDDCRADRESATRNSLTRSMIAVGPVRELGIDLQRARRESAARLHSSAGPGWCSFAYLCG